MNDEHKTTPVVDTSREAVMQLLADLGNLERRMSFQSRNVIGARACRLSADVISALLARAQAAEAEIARLTAERDALKSARDCMGNLWAKEKAERDAALAGQVKVKPLVWEQLGDRAWRAPSPLFGSFRVECYGGRPWQALWSVPGFCDTFVDGNFETADDAMMAIEARIHTAPELQPVTFQHRANEWAVACFGEAIASDKTERTHRFLEEALELAQACGCTKGEALQLVDYVFARDQGDVAAEVGDVMNTIAMLCTAHGIDMDAAGHKGLDRCWENIAKTRAKRAAKPAVSPLPVVEKPITVQDAARDTDLLLDAYKGLCVLHRLLDKLGLQAGVKTTSDLADRIVSAHPEFPGRAALRAIAEGKS